MDGSIIKDKTCFYNLKGLIRGLSSNPTFRMVTNKIKIADLVYGTKGQNAHINSYPDRSLKSYTSKIYIVQFYIYWMRLQEKWIVKYIHWNLWENLHACRYSSSKKEDDLYSNHWPWRKHPPLYNYKNFDRIMKLSYIKYPRNYLIRR